MKARFLTVNFLFIVLTVALSDVYAQYFGRNKIQYDNFDWQILKTEHFDIYFYPEMQELAEIGASFAEDAYSMLESKMNHNITHRIPLIFYANHSHFQQTNITPGFLPENIGGFFEFIKGRVVIPSNGSMTNFRRVIVHEMVHVFTQSKVNRVLKDHRRGQSGGLPLWFTEGIADYWSEEWDATAEMIIRDMVLSGNIVPLQRMDAIYGSFLMYKEGQAICKYISENFGEEKLLLLMENIWKASRFSDVMKLTIGLDYEGFDRLWLYDLKKKLYPLLDERDEPNMMSRQVTKDGFNVKPSCYVKDGEYRVSFVSNRSGYANIYDKNLDSPKKPRVLVRGERSADFESFHLLRSRIDANNEGLITFVAKSGAKDAVYIYSVEKRWVIKKMQFDDLVTLFSPNWSPDGQKIVFNGVTFGGQSDLYIVNLSDNQLQRLTNDFYDDRDPAWSPDGRVIAFSSDRTYYGKYGNLNLFLYDLQSGQINYMTCGKHNDETPVWSPDGRYLAFASDRDGVSNIWMIKNNIVEQRPAEEPTGVMTASAMMEPLGFWGNHIGSNRETEQPDEPILSHPSALDLSDELKQLTRFTTSAFDPEWAGQNRLVFVAFQDLSYQIREISDVTEKFENAPSIPPDSLLITNEHWTASKLIGPVESTRISYKKKFSLDIAQTALAQDPTFGLAGGAQIAMSDMLGNQQYHFLIFNNAQTSGDFFNSWNFAITKIERARRVNYAYGIYRINGRYYDRIDSYFERNQYGGYVGASYPFSAFRRVEATINIRKESRRYDLRGQTVDGIAVSNTISYVKDNTIWGYTGPLDGERFNFTLGHTIDAQNNDMNFYSIIVDYRRYFRLGRLTTFAARLMGRINHGKEAYRSYMGGSWDLRLYRYSRFWGQKLFLINNELRFPFINRLHLGSPVGALGFRGIIGALFLDVGQAWDDDYRIRSVLGSLGVGFRVRVGGFLVLRFEMGKTFQVRGLTSPNLTFDDGIKKAFWFGFDF